MLAVDKIASAFRGIVEEAEKIDRNTLSDEAAAAVKNIISIAKHQNDVRGMPKTGKCGHGHSQEG